MQTEALTVQDAVEYAKSKGLRVIAACKAIEDGEPVIRVAFRERNGDVGRMCIWIECGRIYGDW